MLPIGCRVLLEQYVACSNPAVPINLIKHQYYPLIVYDCSMNLSSYRMQRIYLAATMGYGLGSDDPEELSYYNKIRKDMEDMKKDSVKRGIPLFFDIKEYKEK